MNANVSSALWLELLGGLLVVLGALLAGLAFTLAGQTIDPSLEKNLLRIRLDLPGFLDGLARHLATAGAWMAGVGALLFLGPPTWCGSSGCCWAWRPCLRWGCGSG